jgi:hypothetical protein
MWTPDLIAKQAATLHELGLAIPVQNLSNPSSSTLQAVVSLGGCSGSFVSRDGLVITNHHCVEGMLNYLSNQERSRHADEPKDFVKDGFYARTRVKERPAGPSERIFVTQVLRDVTSEVMHGVLDEQALVKRAQKIKERINAIVAAEKALVPNSRVEVKSFFSDETFTLIRQLEIQDVRLVYAPPSAVGFYGGDTDNWVWPRHTGDFGILRAYVAPDGSARPYHPDNVPYQPQNFLKVAVGNESWVKANDLVLVAGYPGSTNRLDTGEEVQEEVTRQIPHQLERYGSFRALLKVLSDSDPALATKLQSRIFAFDNFLKNRREALSAMQAIDYVSEKMREQEQLRAWVAADPARQRVWGAALEELEALRTRYAGEAEKIELDESIIGHDLVTAALEIVSMAHQRLKPDANRAPAYQECNWQQWREEQEEKQERYDRRISKAILAWKLQRGFMVPLENWSPALRAAINPDVAKEDFGEGFIDTLYQHTQLEDLNVRLRLFAEATPEELRQSSDSFIRFALKLRIRAQELQNREQEIRGAYIAVRPNYIKALRAFYAAQGKLLAPDANSSLRVTFGHVKGYTRSSDHAWQAPFTNLSDLLTKHKWNDPEFEVPANLQRALHAKNFAPYGDPTFGNIPMNFLASVDTTGGNSGSPALNRKGELVGLLFDGNKDALFSDWVFKDDAVRSILVDIRYVLWYLDKVAHADNVVRELLAGQ